MDLGILIARLVLGLLMAAHGAQKLLGWFGGPGIAGTAGFFEGLGFRPGKLFAVLASSTELASGLLVALGLLGPLGPAAMIAVMVVAAGSVLALTGPGAYSLDRLLGLTAVWTPAVASGALALGLVGGAVNLALRRPAASAPAA